MLKTLVTATAISGLMLSGAMAQTPAPVSPSTTAGTPQFVAAQKADQWLGSKFMGTDVLGPNNEKVGDVNDVLFDKSGRIAAVIVGVGGFLGIGEKDVALDMTAFEVIPGSTGSSTNTAAVPSDMTDTKLKVALTKDQLKNAPSFERYRPAARTTDTTAPANTGTRPTPTTPGTAGSTSTQRP